MKWVYNLTIACYHLLLIIASPFNSKARRFLEGRKNWRNTLKDQLENKAEADLIWIHAASQGEYQQGLPIIKELKKTKPDSFLLLSFFSPSGFDAFDQNEHVDAVTFLPLDYPKNVSAFIDLVKPKVAVFVKYEFWYNYMIELYRQKVPLLLISSIFRPDQMFFHSMGKFYLNALKLTDHFFVQDEHSAALLHHHGIDQVTITGDSRLDQMLSIKEEVWTDDRVESFIGESLVIICGSIWPSDWDCLKRVIQQFSDIKVIIAPHEVSQEALTLYGGVRWSQYADEAGDLLLIDQVGSLKYLYRYADIAYVGGALRGAVHNTIEPAVYNIPIVIAEHTKNSKFNEVMDLKDHGGLVTFEDEDELFRIFEELIQDASKRKEMGQSNLDYVMRNSGATEKVMQKLQEYL
ncbi:MAG: hypothetical protein CMB80_14160 [Flammeovirgaceae bacterium]|nr:hypothetical protein [Flammeovirgaceae bacterium]MBE62429.1 hypothetical protein [Flammeovirgaceae bacterium]HCX22881.1 hypothetical protein [Cytophagales bacterium]|tara:strand:+ start:1292 stop:2509 length:1218 start_codon:yes stop_codon:yes gene_type:complete